MSIPRTIYKGFELTAYADQTYPTHHDPYSLGPRRYASVVRIEQLSPKDSRALRYLADVPGVSPTSLVDALNAAVEAGKSIIDHGFKAVALDPTVGISWH